MVKFVLLISANLENLTDLEPEGGCDDPNFSYCFKMKCGNCGEVTKKESYVSLNETVYTQEGPTNLVQKCKLCERYGTVTMVSGKGRPLTWHCSKLGTYLPLMHFDFSGYEPVEFVFGSGWKAESSYGSDLSKLTCLTENLLNMIKEGKCPVTIYNVRATFQQLNQLPYGGASYVPE